MLNRELGLRISSIFAKAFAGFAIALALGACVAEKARTVPPVYTSPDAWFAPEVFKGRHAPSLIGERYDLTPEYGAFLTHDQGTVTVAKYDDFGYGIAVEVISGRRLSIRSAASPQKELTYLRQTESVSGSARAVTSNGVIRLSDEEHRQASEAGLQLLLSGVIEATLFSAEDKASIGGFLPPEAFRNLAPAPQSGKR